MKRPISYKPPATIHSDFHWFNAKVGNKNAFCKLKKTFRPAGTAPMKRLSRAFPLLLGVGIIINPDKLLGGRISDPDQNK